MSTILTIYDQPAAQPLRPLLHQTLCRTVGQYIPPASIAMPSTRVHPRRTDPLDLRATLKALPPMPVLTIGEGGAE